ncbi:MAG: methionyl-tRNA formyltransferase [bacterium]
MRIVFMGNPSYAIPSLEALTGSRHHIAVIVTSPDKQAGRSLKLTPPPVKEWAQLQGIPVLQPLRLKDPDFLSALRTWGADLGVIVGFRILPPEVIRIFPKGLINLHFSLLPELRGPAPVQWAILNGFNRTGISTFLIDDQVDTGNILLQQDVAIGEEEVATELTERLARLGAQLMVKTLDWWEEGKLTPLPQVGTPTHAPKISNEMRKIDWSSSAEEISRLVRALAYEPGAYTFFRGERVNIYRAVAVPNTLEALPGTVLEARGDYLVIKAGSGGVHIKELQRAGKKRMSSSEFLRGAKNIIGTVWG